MKRSFYFTEHALQEMDNDDLEIEDIMRVAEKGDTIEDYPKDKPFPSCLKLGWSLILPVYPIHVVCAYEDTKRIHIITAYKPDKSKWDLTYKMRKK